MIEALKKLAVALECAKDVESVKGETIEDLINFIAENLPKPKAKSKG